MTNVQTNLDLDDFKELEEICKREKISKRKALKIAILEWIRRKRGFNPDDALFNFEAGSADVHFGSENVDSVVYKKKELIK
ncbi:MAG: hypothetical protein ACTSRS_15010 [Candidatus Helarchaeota archaeon]